MKQFLLKRAKIKYKDYFREYIKDEWFTIKDLLLIIFGKNWMITDYFHNVMIRNINYIKIKDIHQGRILND